MLKEAHRLYRLGFAIHWLRANSKAPVDKKWTKGPRKKWPVLHDEYRHGLNIGVRLGEPSRFSDKEGGGYLAVIDCDVKSAQPRHRKEMRARLKELISSETPTVQSGRGNGSQHLYVRTKEPTAEWRVAQSSEKVEVQMPSVAPSKFERDTLTQAQLESGVRVRYAWEITVMGNGRQVVLPPSTHPDTGGSYEWSSPLEKASQLAWLKAVKPEKVASADEGADHEPFEAVSVDLFGSELPLSVVSLVTHGKNCSDRSGALFGVVAAMVKTGFTDNEILSVLTEKSYYLGGAAFDHAQTTSRKRAAEWVRRYTLTKVKGAVSASHDFAGIGRGKPADEGEALTHDEAKAQRAELDEAGGWEAKLDRCGPGLDAPPRATLDNIRTILVNAVSPLVFKRDLFSGVDVYGVDAPWNEMKTGDTVHDIDITNLIYWLSDHYRFEAPERKVYQAIAEIASKNGYHPVRDYLDALKWDGVERLNTWLREYLGASGPEAYLSAVGRKVVCAMVARVYEPGCKFEQVLILEGGQGIGKSSAVRRLGGAWFSDAHINVHDKDAVVALRSVWVLELGELSGMRKADANTLKEFISRQTDRIRMPYGKLAEDFPRQCVFVGTTNSEDYLKDPTGNRRYWPVKMRQLDFKAFKRDRDQLLAEAVAYYGMGEKLYLDDPTDARLALEQQSLRVSVDEWESILGKFLAHPDQKLGKKPFTLTELFSDFGPLPNEKDTPHNVMRAAAVLKSLGYVSARTRKHGGRSVKWHRPEKIEME